jgi:hypothetical protein
MTSAANPVETGSAGEADGRVSLGPRPSPGAGASPREWVERAAARLASGRPELAGFVAVVLWCAGVYIFTSPRDPQSLDYFNRLAAAFLQGRIWLDDAPSWLNELVPAAAGQWFVPYPPMPAVMALPFVALLGPDVPAQLYSSLYAALAMGLLYLLLGRLGLRYRDRLALTGVFAFGTAWWFVSISGSAWYVAHVGAVLFMLASLLCAIGGRSAFGAGLCLGLAAMCRLPVGLAAPFVLAALLDFPTRPRDLDVRRVMRAVGGLAAGLAGPVLAYAAYDLARWGTPLDLSYVRIPGVLDDPIYAKHGILSPWYVPRNVYAILFRSWNYVDDPPWLQPSWWGLWIFLTTPLLLWLARARVRDPRVGWALLGTALVSIPILTHGNVGITQFGYRFSLDFQVLLFVVLATVVAARGWSRLAMAASVASVAFCAYAIWAIGIGFVAF